MTPQDNKRRVLKKGLLAILLLIIGIAIGSGGLWLWLQPSLSSQQDAIVKHQAEISRLKKLNQSNAQGDGSQSTVEETAPILTDRQILQALTISRSEQAGPATFWAPVDLKISGQYARTGVLPIEFSTEMGYQIQPMDGVPYFWYKDDAGWKYIGSCAIESCQMEPGFKYEDLPNALLN